MLIGRLTRDPDLKYTPNNRSVCSFAIATNRTWVNSDTKEKQESVEFHNIVAWAKLADICGSMLHKGDLVYVEGRLQTRKWTGDDKVERRTTEVVIDNMVLLKSMNDAPATAGKKSSKKSEGKLEELDTSEDFDMEDVSDDVPF
jgi:single-strand DNA-binding protein